MTKRRNFPSHTKRLIFSFVPADVFPLTQNQTKIGDHELIPKEDLYYYLHNSLWNSKARQLILINPSPLLQLGLGLLTDLRIWKRNFIKESFVWCSCVGRLLFPVHQVSCKPKKSFEHFEISAYAWGMNNWSLEVIFFLIKKFKQRVIISKSNLSISLSIIIYKVYVTKELYKKMQPLNTTF